METQNIDSYKRLQVETADQLSLILMLYDRAILLLDKAKKGISEKNCEEKHRCLTKASDIVYELLLSLDMNKGGEIADLLTRLYNFVIREMMYADINLDIKAVDNAKTILSELRKSWEDIKSDPNTKIQGSDIPEVNLNLSG
jgi:flagellar secretion chaperone FliS